jgi:hypothetical protein
MSIFRFFGKAKEISTATKLGIFKTSVKSLWLYGSETWKCTKKIFQSANLYKQVLKKNLGLKQF